MGYKQMDNNLTFTDLSLFNSMEHNRSIKRMEKINAIINWPRIESLLLKHYTVGKSAEGADAYPPLLLLKCFLIQQWFHIDFDPELETQINDRSLSLICKCRAVNTTLLSGLQKRASRKQQKDDVYSRARIGYCFECYPVYQQHRLPFSVA